MINVQSVGTGHLTDSVAMTVDTRGSMEEITFGTVVYVEDEPGVEHIVLAKTGESFMVAKEMAESKEGNFSYSARKVDASKVKIA